MSVRRLLIAAALTMTALIVPVVTKATLRVPQGSAGPLGSSPGGTRVGKSCPQEVPAAFFEKLNFRPDGSYRTATSLTGVLHVCPAQDGTYSGIVAVKTEAEGKRENADWNTQVHLPGLKAGEDSGSVQRFYQQVQGPQGTKTCIYAKLKDGKTLLAQSEVCVVSSG